jgi:hypothetical protein
MMGRQAVDQSQLFYLWSPSLRIRQLDPDRRMVAGARLASDCAVHTSGLKE